MVLQRAVADRLEHELDERRRIGKVEVGRDFAAMAGQLRRDFPCDPVGDLAGSFDATDAWGELDHRPVQRGLVRMRDQRRVDHRVHALRERRRRAGPEGLDERVGELFAVMVDDGGRERLLVGKILVERADAHPGALGDLGRGQRLEPMVRQKLSRGDDDRLDGGSRAGLPGEFAWIHIHLGDATDRLSESECKM